MKIKKFHAPTMEEALKQVKSEFGPDAVILSTQKFQKNDSFGIFSKPWIEVVAAVDFKEEVSPNKNVNVNLESYKANTKINDENYLMLKEEIERIKTLLAENLNFHYEIPELKKMISLLMKKSGIYEGDFLNDNFISIYEDLVMQDVDKDIAYKLLENLSFELGKDAEKISIERLKNIFKLKLREKIKIYDENNNIKKPKLIAFIGPTGVGKTTTLAKIAARYSLINKKKTALFTLDTYRVAASEQLKIYGKILKTPVIVLDNRKDFLNKISHFEDFDYILIDTAGRSHRDSFHIKRLKEVLKGSIDIHLTISATTKTKDLDDIISRFSIIPFTSLLFTKLDESSTFGNIITKAIETGKPLSYFTTGQRVPEDIEKASVDKIIDIILGLN